MPPATRGGVTSTRGFGSATRARTTAAAGFSRPSSSAGRAVGDDLTTTRGELLHEFDLQDVAARCLRLARNLHLRSRKRRELTLNRRQLVLHLRRTLRGRENVASIDHRVAVRGLWRVLRELNAA